MSHYITDANKNPIKVAGNSGETDVNTAILNFQTQLDNKPNTIDVNTSKMGVPSNSGSINIAWSGSTYTYFTAPANGYVYMRATGQGGDNLLRIRTFTNSSMGVEKMGASSQYNGTYWSSCCSCPVKKGDYCELLPYNVTGLVMQFIPAEEV